MGKNIQENIMLMYGTNFHPPRVHQLCCHRDSTHRDHLVGYFNTQASPACFSPQTYSSLSSHTAPAGAANWSWTHLLLLCRSHTATLVRTTCSWNPVCQHWSLDSMSVAMHVAVQQPKPRVALLALNSECTLQRRGNSQHFCNTPMPLIV